jgi:hypothetical protein
MSVDPLDELHISLGLDCTLAYQLKKHNLRSFALPFDWANVKNISSLIDIINGNFFNFLKKEEWVQEPQSNKFFSFGTNDDNSISETKSLCRLSHRKYNIILPHEAINDTIDFEIFINKYSRRIERFANIFKLYSNIKIYVGVDKINDVDKQKLNDSIDKFSNYSNNFELIFIEYSKYICAGEFNWTREYIIFNDFFKNK